MELGFVYFPYKLLFSYRKPLLFIHIELFLPLSTTGPIFQEMHVK
jgi:hypothetical protein